ncbi:ATP-dependent endonuclease of the OLD family-like protein [Halomonas sp. R57-5]|nr:ATP-dependent endonuclease of the OLD family-like protein [Halomonas sp. R57-5]
MNNIPFYQKVLSQFFIPYSVICDTDKASIIGYDNTGNPRFDSGIQKSISDQFGLDLASGISRVLRCHETTFEPAHRDNSIPTHLRMPDGTSQGKPGDANKYWKDVLLPNLNDPNIDSVPIISAMNAITV